MSKLMTHLWYGSVPFLPWLLFPFSCIYRVIMSLRRWVIEQFLQVSCPVPIIVIGNISVGGVGKTPLVIALAQAFSAKGLKVGIVSRGYGAKIRQYPYEVGCDEDAMRVGDEPLLLAQKTQCPVVIAPKRLDAINYLLTHHHSDIILSDDGLQHYKMGRSIEIAVIDGTRGLGNGLCLPAGPLRESKKRLDEVDFIVVNEGQWDNAYSMHLIPEAIKQLSTSASVDCSLFHQGTCVAVAGIGNPQRFYSTLQQLGIKFTPYSYPDHHVYKREDLNFGASKVIMTEKDAVKCRALSSDKLFFLPINAVLEESFWRSLWSHRQLQAYRTRSLPFTKALD